MSTDVKGGRKQADNVTMLSSKAEILTINFSFFYGSSLVFSVIDRRNKTFWFEGALMKHLFLNV